MKRNFENINYNEATVVLAKFVKASGHPTRITILKHIENRSYCFTGDLIKVLPISQSTVLQHLKKLKNVGLIQSKIKQPKIEYCVNQKTGIL